MQLRNILLAATIVALPATVHAQPVNGWYIGAGIGVNDLLDSSVNKPAAGIGNKLTSNLGGALVGSVGYGYANGLRTEIELNGRTQKSHFKVPAGISGNSATYGAMVNVLYDIDVGGVDHRLGERLIHQFGGELGEVQAFPGQVAGEVALVAAQDPDVVAHIPKLLQRRGTVADDDAVAARATRTTARATRTRSVLVIGG